MLGVVLAEHHIDQVLAVVDQRERIELVLPDDVVGDLQRGIGRRRDELVKRRHEFGNGGIGAHAADAVIAAGDDAQQLAFCGTVLGHGNGGVTGLFLQSKDISQRRVGTDVGIGLDKARLIALDASDHGRLVLDGLRAVDEGDAALRGQGNGHFVVGNRLHDRGYHRDIHGQGALFFALAIFHQRGFEAHIGRNALRRGITGNQQVFAESAARLGIIKRHFTSLLRPNLY